ncbi:tetratricopeptide repeat protein [Tolypothrix sp. VBCCA 56010]|uniref:tetratricopeptide repeat protein n=1 Tax=Tolypothrix sp. VBCCA 56010 TaxID=3137731 RepID=UPI003D7D8C2D
MNNPQKKPKSLQDILQQRQQSGFVGREEQVSLFRQNLDLSLEDSRRHFLFNVWGQGGVGKSTLLRQFRKIAEEAKMIAAHTDDSEKSVPEAMGRLAEQLEQQNHKLPQFTDRYKVYRQKRQELESDPEAPQGFSAFVGKTVAKTGVLLARRVPVGGAVFDFIDEDAVASQADDLFNWLKEMPFIEERTEGWAYHEVVKTQMLRHKRLSSPQSWADLHGKLAEYYDTLRNNLQLNEEKKQGDTTWQSHALNVLYHGLCQTPHKSLPVALNDFLPALDNQRSFGLHWAETMVQAGKNGDNAEIQRWGEQLVNGLKAYKEKRYEVAVGMFTALLKHSDIQSQSRSIALGWQGNIYRWMQRYEEALKKFDCAIELNPKLDWAIARRALTYHLMERYEEALKDFDQAIALNSKLAWTLAGRGETYRLIKRYEEALKDFDCAIELDPKYAWAITGRGQTYRSMKHYEEALKDFDQAIKLDPKLVSAIASRGETYNLMRRYEEALKDVDQAIELNPEYDWAIASRGETYLMLKRYNEALENFNCAIKLKPDNDWYLYSRALAYQGLNQVDKARVDLNNATKLAQQTYQKDAKNWRNTLNLALYYLIGGNVELSQRLYQYAVSSHAPLERIREAIRDLEDFSSIFPEYIEAQSMRKFLQSSLR